MPPSPKRIKISPFDEKNNIIDEDPSTSKGNDGDWRDNALGSTKRHTYAMKHGILTDVSFVVGPQETTLHAHKMILALASPVFEVMFYGSLKETNETVKIPDLMPSGFQLLLNYVYFDETKFENEMDAIYAWFAADKYCLSQMRDDCCDYLSKYELTNHNVWVILENSVFLNSSSLTERCLLYLNKHIEEAIKASGFLEISSETFRRILRRSSLHVKEISLLKGIVRWSEEKFKCEAGESLQQFLMPFLELIRFGSITQVEFVEFIDSHKDIISDNDALAILKYMTDSSCYTLPKWCSHNVYLRSKSCEKNKKSLKFTVNIRSYAIKPQSSSSQSIELTNHRQSNNERQDNESDSDSDFSLLSEEESLRRVRRSIPVAADDSDSDSSSSSSSSSSGSSSSSISSGSL